MIWIWWTLAFVVAAYTALFVHESSHALIVMWRGGKIVSFKPYPHKNGGTWWFGMVRYLFTADFRHTKWRHGSPLLFNGPLIAVWSALAYFFCPYLWCFAAWAAIDFIWFFRGWFGLWASPELRVRLDGWKFRHYVERVSSGTT